MSKKNPQWGSFPSGPDQGGPQQSAPGYGLGAAPGYGPAYGQGSAYGPGYGQQAPGPQPGGPPPGAGPRIDALDVLEGVLRDGFSLSNLTRIARASGSNFWVGTAIGAGVVVLLNRPDVRAAITSVFSKATAPEPEVTPPSPPPPPEV